MKDWRIKLDVAFVAAIAVTAVITLCSCSGAAEESAVAEFTPPATTAPVLETDPVPVTQPTVETTAATEPVETTQPVETLPPVLFYDIPLSQELQMHIIREAEAHGIDPAIVFAMAYRESNYNAGCIGDSGSSLGLLQVQPYWHKDRMARLDCPDLLDTFQNATVAIDYLAELLTTYNGIEQALVAYNRGHYSGTVTEYARAVLNIAEGLRGETYLLYR